MQALKRFMGRSEPTPRDSGSDSRSVDSIDAGLPGSGEPSPSGNNENSQEEASLWDRMIHGKKKTDSNEKAQKDLPDPPAEKMAPFDAKLTPKNLYELFVPKNIDHLKSLGGVDGVVQGLHSDPKRGLSTKGPEFYEDKRKKIYGVNWIPHKPPKSFFMLMWLALQDKILILLIISAIVSLALGLYEDLGGQKETYKDPHCPPENDYTCVEPSVDWIEGVAVLVAVAVVVLVGSLNDYQKERQFVKLNAQKDDRQLKVVRNGEEVVIDIRDILVGDVLYMEPGDILPVDGVFLEGFNVLCDESSATGESDAVKKITYNDALQGDKKGDCLIVSGSKVVEGVGRYIVTGVGESSFYGRILMSLRGESPPTPLQVKLNYLADYIAKIALTVGGLMFIALMIRFFVDLKQEPDRSGSQKGKQFIQILIICITIIVAAVPEGLPLAVTLSLAFATRYMSGQNLLVRVLSSCETMGQATCICTDKTGTLTQNRMTVVAGSIGIGLKFADKDADEQSKGAAVPNDVIMGDADDVSEFDRTTTGSHAVPPPDHPAGDPNVLFPPTTESQDAAAAEGKSPSQINIADAQKTSRCDVKDVSQAIPPELQTILNDSIAINSTAFAQLDDQGNEGEFVGSKTETALLAFARDQNWPHYKKTRDSAEILQIIPFSSKRKFMGVVVRLPSGKVRVYLKGAAEVLSSKCDKFTHVVSPTEFALHDFSKEARDNLSRTIIFYANHSLRTLALVYRDFDEWSPPKDADDDEDGSDADDKIVSALFDSQGFVFVSVVGIMDPLRPGVRAAVQKCHDAGVSVLMCTGDNILTARAIALNCGIYTAGGVVMEGKTYRNMKESQRMQITPRLQVLARSSPEDKKLLVETQQALGQVVAVTGDGTNDGPALKTADVGFSMGIAGTETAKEASDIVLMDDRFSSIVTAIMWGRSVNESVRKFLQFQVTVSITAVGTTFITSVASKDSQSALSAVQLLWVNLIMDVFAALALASDPATPDQLERKPDRESSPLFTTNMWLSILIQSAYQLAVTLILHFGGHKIYRYNADGRFEQIRQDNVIQATVFNAFVFMQIFNQLNCRTIRGELNIFKHLTLNYMYFVIFAIMVGGQVLIMFVGGQAFQIPQRIKGRDWAVSIICGLFSLVLGLFVHMIPSEPVDRFFIKVGLYKDPEAEQDDENEDHEASGDSLNWNDGINRVIDNLNVFAQVRGGRLRGSNLVNEARSYIWPKSKRANRAKSVHPTDLMTMVPALVMSSIGYGWRPSSGSLSDPASSTPADGSVQLLAGSVGIHPDTPESDPLVQMYGYGEGQLSPSLTSK